MFTTYFDLGVVPRSWTRALVCPVPKKGDLEFIANYRPISLTETGRKLFELCLLRYMSPITPLSREQGGFRSRRSTIDQIDCLDKLIKSAPSASRSKHMAFLDIKAAYDSVPREELWRQCFLIGYPLQLIHTLRSLFDHNSGQLCIKSRRSKPFGQPAGVLQGSVLSPLLYSVYIDPLVAALRSNGPVLTLPNGHQINSLLYADDIVLISGSPSDLVCLLRLAEADAVARGYSFSPTKCVVLSNSFSRHRLHDRVLDNKEHFNYLGMEFSVRGLAENLHVDNRIGKLRSQASALASIGVRYLGFHKNCSVRLYKTFLRPGLEYGLTLIRSQSALNALEVAQKSAICTIFGLHINSLTVPTLALADVPSMTVRRACLTHDRLKRLQHTFDSDDWMAHALPFVSVGLGLPPPSSSLIYSCRSELLEALHFEPRRLRFASLFGNLITFDCFRLLLAHHIPWSESRMLLLWIFRKFNSFNPLRPCRVCGSAPISQFHVAICGSILSRMSGIPRLAPLCHVALGSNMPIEVVVSSLESSDPTTHHPPASYSRGLLRYL